MKRLSGFVELMRPLNCLVMGFAVVVGSFLADPGFFGFAGLWLNVLFGALTGVTLTGASMAINDYYDREIDLINEPLRPIPRGAVLAWEALVFAAFLSVVGFVFAYLVSVICFIAAFIAWIIMMTYSTVGKKSGLPGNFLVSACVAIPFLYGSLVVIDRIGVNVVLFAGMAFFSNTGREITKGIVDVKGDEAEGVKTLAVKWGSKEAAFVGGLFYVLAVALTPLPVVLGVVSFWFIPFVLITDLGFIWVTGSLLKNPSRKNARKIKKQVLFLFILGLISFLIGVVG